jgi:hypothetical protein
LGRPETQNRPPLCGPFPGISVLENAKERPSAWPSVVFMEPWSTRDPLLIQATLSTRPNLFKEAPWVGQRRKTGPPPSAGPFRSFQTSKIPRNGRAPGQALFLWSYGALKPLCVLRQLFRPNQTSLRKRLGSARDVKPDPPSAGPFGAFRSSKTLRKGRAPGQAMFLWSHGAP